MYNRIFKNAARPIRLNSTTSRISKEGHIVGAILLCCP